MKNLFAVLFLLGGLVLLPQDANAQFFKKLVKRVDSKIKSEAEARTNKRADKAVDKSFDAVEDAIDGKNKKSTSSDKKSNDTSSSNKNLNSSQDGNSNGDISVNQNTSPTMNWSRFDFVPGETVLFEDSPATDEENGEFPSRWDLYKGNSEIIEFGGETVISFPNGGSIVPYLKDSDKDYLPEVFTIEADVFWPSKAYHRPFKVFLSDEKNQRNNIKEIYVYKNSVSVGDSKGTLSGKDLADKQGSWRHVSIAYTKGKLKVYLDQTRLINFPHYDGNPSGVTIVGDGYAADGPDHLFVVKNIRIAKGGVKYYDRVKSEGKIIVNGIKFDVNKATLKPESMGPINEIYELMAKNTDIKFSVEGHTDSDGDDDFNMELSIKRGQAVMNKLIEMGISSDRLKFTGYGESKPIDNNSSSEGKANNRRVEFVKF